MYLMSHCAVSCIGWKFINSFGHTSITSKWLPNKPQWSSCHQSSYCTAFQSNVESAIQRFRIKSHSQRNLLIEFISLQVLGKYQKILPKSAQTPHSALYQSVVSFQDKNTFSEIHLQAPPASYWRRRCGTDAHRILEHGAMPFQTRVWMHPVQQLVCIYSSSKKKRQAEGIRWSLTSTSFSLQISSL